MKISLFLSLFFIGFLYPQSNLITRSYDFNGNPAVDYDPIEIGNKWVYRGYYNTHTASDSANEVIEVLGEEVLSDGYLYRKIIDQSDVFGLHSSIFYERIDSLTGKSYLYRNYGSGYIFKPGDDLSANIPNTFYDGCRFGFSGATLDSILMTSIFGLSDTTKLFHSYENYSGVSYNLIRNIGLANYTSGGLYTGSLSFRLKGCKIRGIVYGDLNNTLGIKELPFNIISDFELYQNYPNPFNPETIIRYKVASPGMVTIKVFDVLGNQVAILADEYKPAGIYEINFDGSKLSSGTYFYDLISGTKHKVMKAVLLK